MTEIFLMFLQSVLPVFTHANQFLQRDEPLIHVLQPQLMSLLKKVLAKYIKPPILVCDIQKETLLELDFKDPNNHVNDEELVIGFVTKQTIRKLLDGDIAEHQLSVFYNAVREFFVCATGYLMKWCPLQDELLTHVTWIGFEQRLEKTFSSVEYIVGRYPNLLSGMDMDKLNEQYLSYQVLTPEEIPAFVKERTGLDTEDSYRVDHL